MSYLIHIATQANGVLDPAATTPFDKILTIGSVTLSSDEAILSFGANGCAVGHLFSRQRPFRRIIESVEDPARPIDLTEFRSRCQHLWGSFVAIMTHGSQLAAVFRDPSGMMPCYFRRTPSTFLISDDARLLGGSDGIDDLAIGRLLYGLDALGRQTCLRGVEELAPGECIVIRGQEIEISRWWTSWDHAAKVSIDAFESQADQLRQTIMECIKVWSECFDQKLIGVSGGLDSSIVAACIGPGADLRCVTFLGPDAEGDESDYAEALTTSLGRPLERQALSLSAVDVERACLPHIPWPVASYVAQASEAIHRDFHGVRRVDAVFSGNGGDNILYNVRSAIPLVDRLMVDGLGRGARDTLNDLLLLTGSDLGTVAKATWQRYRRRHAGHVPGVIGEGLGPDLVSRVQSDILIHPWWTAPSQSLPGKATHVALLLRGHRSLELYPRSGSPAHIAPLLSQPIVELCLAIPSWRWIIGGRNRAIARKAFDSMLPSRLIDRRSKGGPGGFVQAIYWAQKARLTAMLHDGILMQRGIIDRRYLEEPVDPTQRGRAKVQRLLAFGAAEAWARFWLARTSAPPAWLNDERHCW